MCVKCTSQQHCRDRDGLWDPPPRVASSRSTPMPSASLLLKCLLGAGAVLLIALLSRSRSFFIAGMVPLFPTFALIAHYIVGTERSAADLRATALFGLFALFPYAVYLGLVFLLSVRTGLATTLFAALAGWFVAAGAVLLLWTRYTAPSF